MLLRVRFIGSCDSAALQRNDRARVALVDGASIGDLVSEGWRLSDVSRSGELVRSSFDECTPRWTSRRGLGQVAADSSRVAVAVGKFSEEIIDDKQLPPISRAFASNSE